MIDFTKEDIEPLDWMVNEVIIKYTLTPDDLIKSGIFKEQKGLEIDVTYNLINEFKRYLYVLNKYEVCDCTSRADMLQIRSNEYTLQFKTLGGFKNLFDNLTKQEEKDDVDFKLAKKMLKEYPTTKWIARISFLIGILALIVSLLQWLNTLSSQ